MSSVMSQAAKVDPGMRWPTQSFSFVISSTLAAILDLSQGLTSKSVTCTRASVCQQHACVCSDACVNSDVQVLCKCCEALHHEAMLASGEQHAMHGIAGQPLTG